MALRRPFVSRKRPSDESDTPRARPESPLNRSTSRASPTANASSESLASRWSDELKTGRRSVEASSHRADERSWLDLITSAPREGGKRSNTSSPVEVGYPTRPDGSENRSLGRGAKPLASPRLHSPYIAANGSVASADDQTDRRRRPSSDDVERLSHDFKPVPVLARSAPPSTGRPPPSAPPPARGLPPTPRAQRSATLDNAASTWQFPSPPLDLPPGATVVRPAAVARKHSSDSPMDIRGARPVPLAVSPSSPVGRRFRGMSSPVDGSFGGIKKRRSKPLPLISASFATTPDESEPASAASSSYPLSEADEDGETVIYGELNNSGQGLRVDPIARSPSDPFALRSLLPPTPAPPASSLFELRRPFGGFAPGLAPTQRFIALNVGGTRFETTVATLLGDARLDSHLTRFIRAVIADGRPDSPVPDGDTSSSNDTEPDLPTAAEESPSFELDNPMTGPQLAAFISAATPTTARLRGRHASTAPTNELEVFLDRDPAPWPCVMRWIRTAKPPTILSVPRPDDREALADEAEWLGFEALALACRELNGAFNQTLAGSVRPRGGWL